MHSPHMGPLLIIWISVVLTASMQHLHSGPWTHSRFLCPPQNQHLPSARVTHRPEASCFPAGPVSHLLENVCTHVGWGDIASTRLRPLCIAPSAGTIAPALYTPQTLKISASPSGKLCFDAVSPEPLHLL